jgi:hypothetical protein
MDSIDTSSNEKELQIIRTVKQHKRRSNERQFNTHPEINIWNLQEGGAIGDAAWGCGKTAALRGQRRRRGIDERRRSANPIARAT